jgi:superoxide reductase
MEKNPVFFKCPGCSGTVMVMDPGRCKAPSIEAISVSCSGNEMEMLSEQKADLTKEKHVPVVEKVEGGIKVIVGSTPHPMTEEHHIAWIGVQAGDNFMLHYLKPGDAPEAFFPCPNTDVKAYEFCNIHNLWVNR